MSQPTSKAESTFEDLWDNTQYLRRSKARIDSALGMSIPQLLRDMPSAEEQEDSVNVGGKLMPVVDYERFRDGEEDQE